MHVYVMNECICNDVSPMYVCIHICLDGIYVCVYVCMYVCVGGYSKWTGGCERASTGEHS